MDQKEWEHWQAVTESSAHKWVEDRICKGIDREHTERGHTI